MSFTCDADAWIRQNQPGQRPVCHTCLTTGQSIALAFSAFAGTTSIFAVLALFGVVAVRFYHASPIRRRGLLSYIDVFMTNLFLSELIMALGGLLDAKWAGDTQVSCGGFCNAQGALLFLGETSLSIWTLLITLYTWMSVVRTRRLTFHPFTCGVIVTAVWVYVLAFHFGSHASVGMVDGDDPRNYITPTPFWCWVNPRYKGHRLGEYIWLWIAGVGNIAAYVALYLILRGNLVLGGNGLRSLRWYWTPLLNDEGGQEGERIRKDAFKLLWYPIAYTILVLPLSIVRWMSAGNTQFADPQIPEMTSLATSQLLFHALYRLSGVINVGLVLGTRPNILLLGKRYRDDEANEEHPASDAHSARSLNYLNPLPQQANTTPLEREGEREKITGFGGPSVNQGRDEGYGGHY